jgi:hypothetical protein
MPRYPYCFPWQWLLHSLFLLLATAFPLGLWALQRPQRAAPLRLRAGIKDTVEAFPLCGASVIFFAGKIFAPSHLGPQVAHLLSMPLLLCAEPVRRVPVSLFCGHVRFLQFGLEDT